MAAEQVYGLRLRRTLVVLTPQLYNGREDEVSRAGADMAAVLNSRHPVVEGRVMARLVEDKLGWFSHLNPRAAGDFYVFICLGDIELAGFT